jgi:NAD(P)-dependent dehydrogenase (short-subunit alcohol dehydrogenase family)
MKQILLTGAAGGLGQICCQTFIGQGHKVYGTVSPGKLGLMESDSALLQYLEVDLLDHASVISLFKSLDEQSASLDAIVLLAGGFAMANVSDTDEALLKKMIDLNFLTAFHVCRHALKHFKDKKIKGTIILIGSQTAVDPKTGADYAAYTLSKAMLLTFSEILNKEGEATGIRTHVIVPGTLDTEANKKSMPDADQTNWTKTTDMANLLLSLLNNSGVKESIIKI